MHPIGFRYRIRDLTADDLAALQILYTHFETAGWTIDSLLLLWYFSARLQRLFYMPILHNQFRKLRGLL